MKSNKYLGQNFLTSKKIIEEIIKTADIEPNDVVLEVGPGKGILTEALVKKVHPVRNGISNGTGKVIAVEKDKRMVEFLQEKFKNNKNLKIIHGDILKITRYPLPVTRYKIVANIPYYITSRFLRIFLQTDFQPYLMVLMIQKEVAERIIAKNSKESILSISVKVYGRPKIIKIVPAKYFHPKPKVDSTVLLIDNISKKFFANISEKKFFELVKKGFSSKRKFLKNNLGLSNTECLIRCGIPKKARAEDLFPENWKCLFNYLKNY
jgi:16S rRNA (adenine1518-N6/adenine1519-N6)-dimethyltransferase